MQPVDCGMRIAACGGVRVFACSRVVRETSGLRRGVRYAMAAAVGCRASAALSTLQAPAPTRLRLSSRTSACSLRSRRAAHVTCCALPRRHALLRSLALAPALLLSLTPAAHAARPVADAIRTREQEGAYACVSDASVAAPKPRGAGRFERARVVFPIVLTSASSRRSAAVRDFEAEIVRAKADGACLELAGAARESAQAFSPRVEEGLCATPYGIDIAGILESIALVGALVGGISARQRKAELEEVNDKLRKINFSLRTQARSGVVYAPGLNYAPSATPATESEAQAKPAVESAAASAPTDEIRAALREGRSKLKENNGAAAMVFFKKALMLTRQAGDMVLERRARRGLAVARRAQGDRTGAIADLLAVLEISQVMQEFTGDTDALGAIADLYTETGELEKAGAFYDRYIAALKNETGAVD